MFKQSIRIQNPNIDPKEELEKMKEVDIYFFSEIGWHRTIFLVQNEWRKTPGQRKITSTAKTWTSDARTEPKMWSKHQVSIRCIKKCIANYFFFQNAISNNFQFSELKQIQNEKRRLLVETETEKLKSLDESFKKKFEHWRDKLGPRKQVSPVTTYFSKHYFSNIYWVLENFVGIFVIMSFLWNWLWLRRHRDNPKTRPFSRVLFAPKR